MDKIFTTITKSAKDIQHFKGINGIKSMYRIIMDSWKPKDEYIIAAAPLESFLKLEDFFLKTVHKKRIKDKVVMKILINRNGENYSIVRDNMPYTQVRFLDMDTKTEYGILNDLLFLVDYGKEPCAILIKDKEFATTFRAFFDLLWNQGREIKIPDFTITNKSIPKIIATYKQRKPLIITDPYNYDFAQKLGETFCVKNNDYSNVENARKKLASHKFSMLIGLGGCAALDVARECATPDIKAIMIPTILSTVCISVDKAVFNYNGEDKVFQTENPEKTIVSMSYLLQTHKDNITRWSQSGFGDMFAKIGASIDVNFREGTLTKKNDTLQFIAKKIPETLEALQWTLQSFKGYNREGLKQLASFLHEASAAIIITGGFGLSGGAEHDLAYAIGKRHAAKSIHWPTHGQIVSLGTLIELKLFGTFIGNMKLYEDLRKAYKKIGLPTTYTELENLGITKEYIIQGIKDINHLNTFMSKHADAAIKSLDRIFGGKA
ncbi:MAG: iron-containing alcohol dehydrogenase [Nanoarchaeota archaeon]|nr:iron-containing alcohol dehydrogenase [Nanoarchaeota archaeon]